MKEVEVKILEIDKNRILTILKKNNAKLIMPRNRQVNSFYENNDSVGKTVRIREDANGNTLAIKSKLKVVKNHKVMKEYETKVSDVRALEQGLILIGFKLIGRAELYREDWRISNCVVSIGEFPKIPPYIEIEGSEKNILKVAKLLGYSERDYFPKSILDAYKIKSKFLVFKK